MAMGKATGPSERGKYMNNCIVKRLRVKLNAVNSGESLLCEFWNFELAINTLGLTLVSGNLVPTMEDSSWANMAKGGLGTSQGLGAHHYIHETPSEHKCETLKEVAFCLSLIGPCGLASPVGVALSVFTPGYPALDCVIHPMEGMGGTDSIPCGISMYFRDTGLREEESKLWQKEKEYVCLDKGGEEWDIHEGAGLLLRWEVVALEKGATLSSTLRRKEEGRGVHSVQFMEFSEVENQGDSYSRKASCIHTQDQQGVHVIYEEALSDLKELEAVFLLVASHYTEKEKCHKVGTQPKSGQDWAWAPADVARFAVLYDMWTQEAALLESKYQDLKTGSGSWSERVKEELKRLPEVWASAIWYHQVGITIKNPSRTPNSPHTPPSKQPNSWTLCTKAGQGSINTINQLLALPWPSKKVQLLDSSFEAYQHTLDTEERFALAQVMMDITHWCLRFDLSYTYFIKAYWEEFICLKLHLQLVRGILNQHIERQREYVQRLWQEDHLDNRNTFGLPLNIVCKQLISINNSHPALKNVYLLEFHPSLSLAALIPRALELQEVCHTCKPASASGLVSLERHVLQLALDLWLTPAKPEAWYSAQLQKDQENLFLAKVMGDPFLVGEIGLLALNSAADEDRNKAKTLIRNQLMRREPGSEPQETPAFEDKQEEKPVKTESDHEAGTWRFWIHESKMTLEANCEEA
ncbi:hypothetical protein P7K49_008437 [Saguinus oedipus]|uniref:Uncharacterized protein n=1 Tax=Saguinus oedipus TaxID=9490 RepID=A0ABQ9VYG2_SAGOE|nr:hypothetical protein P7K49_008437 [Saguinus oedipus]